MNDINLKKYNTEPLKALPAISPSRYFSLLQCPLKEIWGFYKRPLLPMNPNAYLGNIIHRILNLAFRRKLSSKDELSRVWDEEVSKMDDTLLQNPLEKHLSPLNESVNNFEVKKLMFFKLVEKMIDFEPRKKNYENKANTKVNTEFWVETTSKKIKGKIDLSIASRTDIEIVDFKSGRLNDNEKKIKEEYLLQIKMYAAMYKDSNGRWPKKCSLIGIDGDKFSIEVNVEECTNILAQAENTLDEINESISKGARASSFARPSVDTCRYCSFRPGCNRYWECRQEEDDWPIDIRGNLAKQEILDSGLVRILLDTEQGNVAIRSLSYDKYPFLNNKINQVMFCNLSKDRKDGFYVSKKYTTGYALE